ncbi:MAGE-domain-containing protein [Epithele typhae]|uniref:MAGE-domain-containing protein n=1 Tax=Epithele typhae TaxID=378194 RepID=UPI0020082F4A|nr:MAGE-domain-containing protein [Epithele typhae]KAH9938796.1 MAGE-domain-containing protein [Epithele typhae]
MPRPGRSQRPQASRSQAPRATQARRATTEEDDEENIDIDAAMAEDGEDRGDAETERKARDLVRLALFHEQRRIPLKRDEISKKVIGSHSRAFPAVLQAANRILKLTFGFELVELHHINADKEMSEKDADLLKNTGVKKKSAASGTKSFILRSCLDPALVELACAPDSDIREIEQQESADENNELAEDNPVGKQSTGSILAWHHADQLAADGVLFTILALILVEGRAVSDSDLRGMLKRLQLPSAAHVPLSSQATSPVMPVDAFLAQLLRQGYLEKLHVGPGAGKRGAKRARGGGAGGSGGGAGDDQLPAYEWRWGPRALSEFGERKMAEFVAEFMAARPGEEDEEEEEVDDGKKKRVEVFFNGIERAAAGGQLLDGLEP